MKSLLFTWVAVYLHYGAQLYFSANQDIDNPELNMAIPWLKDLFWIGLLVFISVCWLRPQKGRIDNSIILITLTNVLFCAGYALFIYLEFGGVNEKYFKVFKNILMYRAAVFVFVNMLADLGKLRFFLKATCVMTTVALFVGILFHYLYPLQSITGRMFGTFGNPNAVGFIALGNLGLFLGISGRISAIYTWIVVGTSVSALLLSASLTALVMPIVFLPIYSLLRQRFRCPIMTIRSLFACVIVCIGGLITVSVMISSGESMLLARAESFISSGESESMDFRTYRWQEAVTTNTLDEFVFGRIPYDHRRTDSSLVDYIFNFGCIGIFVFIFPFSIAVFKLMDRRLLTRSVKERQQFAGIGAAVFTMFLCNTPMQFQFEVFPSNMYVTVLMASLIVMCSPRLNRA